MNPEMIIFTGPMFSSKTTMLISTIEKYKYRKKNVVIFKPGLDFRSPDQMIMSHMGWSKPAIVVNDGNDILKHMMTLESFPDVVALDEAFMVPGSSETLIWLFRKGITIVVSTLDISFSGKPFEEVKNLLPWATAIHKCTAACVICGRDAHYTHKKLLSDEEIEVGGEELYEPRCFHHHSAIKQE